MEKSVIEDVKDDIMLYLAIGFLVGCFVVVISMGLGIVFVYKTIDRFGTNCDVVEEIKWLVKEMEYPQAICMVLPFLDRG